MVIRKEVAGIPVLHSEVLVIGSGGAGLRTAIELHDRKIDVTVVGKCERRDAHTILATGGINAALGNMDPKDSWELHAADTIKDGGLINDTDAVITLCKNAPSAVRELAKWGCPFHREKNGKISQRFFGAATYRRACFSGDYTGREILNTLVNQTLKRKIPFKSEVYILNLLKDSSGKVNGALGLDIRKGKFVIFHCKLVVLCAGGHSRMFKRSSSRFWENNGDGIYLAYDLGGKFMDMEMFQFHPTGMLWPMKADGLLVTEAVRGEGGILTNAKGERFMQRYDKERMELSARDVVARAIYQEVHAGRGTRRNGVWLDISHKPASYIRKRLPRMVKQFKDLAGVDITKEKMEVSPTAHYSMGGLFLDHKTGRTSVKGLYAVGEVTAGVQGGNRLGGNSLAEIVVYGRLTGKQMAKDVRGMKFSKLDERRIIDNKNKVLELNDNKGKNPIEVKKEIQKMMWENAGVVRSGLKLKKGLRELKKYKKLSFKIGKDLKMNEKLINALDVRNMIPTCEMILLSALERKESRAAHYRKDYLKTNSKYKKNIVIEPGKDGFKLKWKAVKPVPKKIKKLMNTKKSKVLLE